MQPGFGAFGKMPSAGDFFRLNPPPGFVAAWDRWLQQVLLDAQAALGADWDDQYMTAPIWRFSLAPGLAGPKKALGVLMPSVDRVGRRFPLTLMAGLDTPGPAPLDHFSADSLFARLEDLALATLEDDMTRDRLAGELARLPVPQARAGAPLRGTGGSLVLTGSAPRGVLPDLASGLLAGRYHAPSTWSATIGDAPRLLICEGLPAGAETLGLFDPNAPIWREARPL